MFGLSEARNFEFGFIRLASLLIYQYSVPTRGSPKWQTSSNDGVIVIVHDERALRGVDGKSGCGVLPGGTGRDVEEFLLLTSHQHANWRNRIKS